MLWSGLLNGDLGAPVQFADISDRSVQIEGTFGVGGTVLIQGSNDGANWRTLTNPAVAALSITTAGVYQVTEATQNIRPNVSAGDGTTSINVTAFFRRMVSP